ncbi:5992_t:CDS:2 [Cetraspora pellucida]|uniref:5992_t:CDS:1 n=1 Tax=Cetraspora pellucida TaxID=1433469 RepID=A0ACA9NJV7_9GLOM|nr:5992_t:CDS:2 [Cetraspora pellucida]
MDENKYLFDINSKKIYIKSQENNPCLSFKNEIINSLYEDSYNINETFITKHIHNDRDKDIIVSKYDVETLISCKHREKGNIRFNNVERTSNISNYYDVQGIIVTNLNYTKNARTYASRYNIILCDKSNLNHKLNFYIEKELDKRELDVLCNILNNEDY